MVGKRSPKTTNQRATKTKGIDSIWEGEPLERKDLQTAKSTKQAKAITETLMVQKEENDLFCNYIPLHITKN